MAEGGHCAAFSLWKSLPSAIVSPKNSLGKLAHWRLWKSLVVKGKTDLRCPLDCVTVGSRDKKTLNYLRPSF